MRVITLELLRHGPAHNQLLSPLTPYLALCENHAPVTIHVPFEHNQFLHRLTTLTYELGEEPLADNQRRFQLSDTGRELSRILGAIPGLTAELNRGGSTPEEVVHLRLVLSCSELALLPFELVLAGNGFPGFGQPLLLQNQTPICLTREVRRVKEPAPWNRDPSDPAKAPVSDWEAGPRVLMVVASPPGLSAVPVEAHLLALRKSLDPWIHHYAPDDSEARRKRVDQRLRVITSASVDAIQDVCRDEAFTHVHILAHGVAHDIGFDKRFGIALHDAADLSTWDVVNGERLASALRSMDRSEPSRFRRPMVVTLASCNGANAGSTVGVGASVAHALHEAGIPLVVAGQFPLTFQGSVELVETLYDGLLWGEDPRALLIDLRRRMHVLQQRSHDWAALVAYASLPEDFGKHLEAQVITRVKEAIEVGMGHAQLVLDDMLEAQTSNPTAHQMGQASTRIRESLDELRGLLHRYPKRQFELRGLLASLCKRQAETTLAEGMVSSKLLTSSTPKPSSTDPYLIACRKLLDESRRYYAACFHERRDASWALVQELSLSLLLTAPNESAETAGTRTLRSRRDEWIDQWWVAYDLSLVDCDEWTERGGWALSNLVELALLAMLLDHDYIRRPKRKSRADGPPKTELPTELVERGEFGEAMKRIRELRRASPEQIRSTRTQLLRYYYWYDLVNPEFGRLAQVATRLLKELPDETDA